MLRNLGILKIRLSFPIRSDQYNTGPLEVSLISIAIAIIGMKAKIKIAKAIKISDKRFSLYLPSYTSRQSLLSHPPS